MPRRRPVDGHNGDEGCDPAVIGAVEHRAPVAGGVLRDLDDAHAMRCHLDLDELCSHVGKAGRILPGDPGEHHLFVGVLVIDAEQRTHGPFLKREEGDVIVVVAELFQLRRHALLARIELRRICEDRVAPAQQHLGIVPGSDVMVLVDACLDFLKVKRGRRRLGRVAAEQGGSEQGRSRKHAQRAAHDVASAVARKKDIADRIGVRRA